MSGNYTFSMIKPNATVKNITGKVNTYFENAGFKIVAQRRVRLTLEQAQKFYEVHKERSFYNELCEFLASGPVVAQVLKSQNAVLKAREIMGDTNPEKAAPGTIRADLGDSIGENTIHGSDSDENAAKEIAFFFSELDICE
jgi:nucleoside-diphosphate kinase